MEEREREREKESEMSGAWRGWKKRGKWKG